MSTVWLVIAILCAGTASLKGIGPLSSSRREPSPQRASVTSLLAPALLAGLVVYETLGSSRGPGLVADARSAGLGVATGALALRLPLLTVVLAAALATAIARTVT